MTHRLSVLIPCKNERDNLPACLASVRTIADEIVVADSGSTDGTLDYVAAQTDCRVVQREYINAGDFKNWAIPQMSHRWVLIVDADERVSPELATEIKSLLQGDSLSDAYAIQRLNFFLGHPIRHSGWGRDRVVRLFQQGRASYRSYTDHSEMEVPSGKLGRLKSKLLHHTCNSLDLYLTKMNRYTQQQAELWFSQGKQVNLFSLCCNGPLRFLRSYVLDRGFLDGLPGLQIALLTGYYSYLKQLRLWGVYHAVKVAHPGYVTAEHPVEGQPRVRSTAS